MLCCQFNSSPGMWRKCEEKTLCYSDNLPQRMLPARTPASQRMSWLMCTCQTLSGNPEYMCEKPKTKMKK